MSYRSGRDGRINGNPRRQGKTDDTPEPGRSETYRTSAFRPYGLGHEIHAFAKEADAKVFVRNAGWRGVSEEGFAAVCTSAGAVRAGLAEGIADLCRAVPDLGGFFSITASENLTNCWSHGAGGQCPRCRNRRPAEVIAEVNATFLEGIRAASGRQRLLAWDWGWADAWALEAIERLSIGVELMSVSEWGLPIERGGVKTTVGEYCLSSIGPGPRAQRHWAAAKKRELSVVAKMQVGTTWEMAAVPYLPAVENVCRHVAALKGIGVESRMLGWTLGGHPSPNIDAVVEIMAGGSIESLTRRRHGKTDSARCRGLLAWMQCGVLRVSVPHGNGLPGSLAGRPGEFPLGQTNGLSREHGGIPLRRP